MQTHTSLGAKILSLALTFVMVGSMLPSATFAAAVSAPPEASATGTIKAFDKLEDRFVPSIGENAPAHVYALSVALDTPAEELRLPAALGVTVERAVAAPVAVASDAAVSSQAEPEVPEAEAALAVDEASSSLSAMADTAASESAPPVSSAPEQADSTPVSSAQEQAAPAAVAAVQQETIPVTWSSDKAYQPAENGKFVYTAKLPEGYALADGVALPQIYVTVGKQARAGAGAAEFARNKVMDFTSASIEKQADTTSWGDPRTEDIDALAVENWKWEAATKTLTLDNLDLNVLSVGSGSAMVLPAGATIVCYNNLSRIRRQNNNNTEPVLNVPMLQCNGAVTITSQNSGRLSVPGEVKSTTELISAIGIQATEIVVNNTKVDFRGRESAAICENLTITGDNAQPTTFYSYRSAATIKASGAVSVDGVFAMFSNDGTGNVIEAGSLTAANLAPVVDGPEDACIVMTCNDANAVAVKVTTLNSDGIRAKDSSLSTDYYIANNKIYSDEANTTEAVSCVLIGTEEPVAVAFTGLTANGASGTAATTELTLTFNKDIAGLTAEHITLTGATKSALTKESGTGVYKLAISDITVANGANVTVAVAKTGIAFTPTSKTVAVYKKAAYNGPEAAAPSGTPSAKTDTSVTLAAVTPPTGETVEYAYSTTNAAPTTGWQDAAEFTGLTANTQYYFFARVKENASHTAGAASAGTAITTDAPNLLAHDIGTGGNLQLTETAGACTVGCAQGTPHIVTGTSTANIITAESGTHYITLNGVSIDVSATSQACAFEIKGSSTVNLTLAEGKTSTLKSGYQKAGISVPEGTTLSIGGTGTLNVNGGTRGAGIGGNMNSAAGNISIDSGTITTTGGNCGAGIGGGRSSDGGNTTIRGGIITATSVGNSAGIGGGGIDGGGYCGAGGTISITGGTVIATGRDGAAIGGGGDYSSAPSTGGAGGSISITGGSVTAIVATGHGMGIGAGYGKSGHGDAPDPLTLTGMVVKYKVDSNYTGATNILDRIIYKDDGQEDYATNIKLLLGYTGTEAANVSSTPSAKTDTTITLAAVAAPTGETIEYAYSTTNTAPTTGWQDSTAFTGLTANTQYYFFARVKENGTHWGGVASAGTAITTAKPPYNGPAVNPPNNNPASKTSTSVTLVSIVPPFGEHIEYACSATNAAPTTGWQDSAAFTGLTAGTQYYFFARVKENATHAAGAPSAGTAIATAGPVQGVTVFGVVSNSAGNNLSGATVTLMQGERTIHTATTDANGVYQMEGTMPGVYKVVVSHNGVTITELVTVGTVNLSKNMQFLDKRKNTVVETAPGAPDVAVGGMTSLLSDAHINTTLTTIEKAAVDNGGSAELKFKVALKTSSEAAADKSKLEALAKGLKIDTILDLTVFKTVKQDGGSVITNNQVMSTLAANVDIVLPIPESLRGKPSLCVYRIHSAAAQKLLKSTPDASGEYFEISADGTYAIVHVKNFSTYALGYTENAPVPPSSTATLPQYTITATAGPGGSLSTGRTVVVYEGESAGFSIIPSKGYQIADVVVNGKSIGAKNYYAFANIRANQTIHATFTKGGHVNPQTGVAD